MRWEALFGDLEGQLAAADAMELAGEVSDRVRREVARIGLADRARAGVGARITVGLGAAGTVSARVARVGPDWLLLEGPGGEQLVPLDAVQWVLGLPAAASEPDSLSPVQARLGLGYVLRGIARDRSALTLMLRDGTATTGTVDRVGADFLDLAEHPAGEPRRADAVRGVRTIAFTAVAWVRTAG
jgi:hypothetical protein